MNPNTTQAVVISDVVGQRGGAYRATALLSEALCDIGLQTTTFVRWAEPDFAVPNGRWRIVRPLIGRGSRWGWPERILARQAATFIRREHPQLIIVVGLTSLCAHLLPLIRAGSTWVWELTNADRGNKFVDPRVVTLLDRVKGLLSPASIIDEAIRKTYGYTGTIERLPFWTEAGPARYLPPPEKFSCDFLFLSRREDDKGLADLIRATAITAMSNRNFLVLIAGSGNADRYRDLAERLHVTDVVRFISLETRTEAMNVLANAKFLVLPSHHEGFPISILEGIQRSVPIITTQVGAIPELLGSNGGALFHEPGNINQLSDIMTKTLSAPVESYLCRREAAFAKFKKTLSCTQVHAALKGLCQPNDT